MGLAQAREGDDGQGAEQKPSGRAASCARLHWRHPARRPLPRLSVRPVAGQGALNACQGLCFPSHAGRQLF